MTTFFQQAIYDFGRLIIFFWNTKGQDYIKESLSSMYSADQLPCAIIFQSARGFGKKTLAIDFARMINCEKPEKSINHSCDSCLRVESMTHPDLVIIDTTSKCSDTSCVSCKSSKSISIKNCVISELIISKAKYKPFMSKKRVVIIDEADNLTNISEESLLKTLEEENDHLIIIILVKDLSKIQDTIISRCQTWRLEKLTKKDLKLYLEEMYPESKKQVIDILSFGEASIGEAIEMINHPIILESKKDAVIKIINMLETTMFEKLRYSKELSILFRKDRELVMQEINLWKNLFREILVYEPSRESSEITVLIKGLYKKMSKLKVQRNLKKVIKIENSLTRNANPLLALDNLLVSLEV